MSATFQSQATGEIANSNVIPSDGDNATAASVDTPFETLTDDVFRLRVRASHTESCTFVEPGDGLGGIATSGNIAGEMCMAAWQLDRRLLHISNDTTIRNSVDGGYTWGTELAGGVGTAFMSMASQTDSTAAVYTLSGSGDIIVTGPGNGWNGFAIAGTTPVVPLCIVADPFNASTYWVGGSDNALPKVWKMVSVNGFTPTQTQVALTGGVAGVNVVAPGRNNILAASNDAGTSHLWSISGGVGTAVTPPSATFITDIQWLDAFNYFLLVASNGSSTLELWTSPTGATGTWTALTSTYLTSLEANAFIPSSLLRGSCVVGPLAGGLKAPCLVIIPISLVGFSTMKALLVTSDGGATWHTLPDPMQRHHSLGPKPLLGKARVLGNRVGVYGYQAAGNIYHAMSVRGGIPA